MAEMNKATVHASERVSARDMIQTPFEGDEDMSLMTDKDVAKMKKKAEKDEKAARAALAAHQVCKLLHHMSAFVLAAHGHSLATERNSPVQSMLVQSKFALSA